MQKTNKMINFYDKVSRKNILLGPDFQEVAVMPKIA